MFVINRFYCCMSLTCSDFKYLYPFLVGLKNAFEIFRYFGLRFFYYFLKFNLLWIFFLNVLLVI